MTSHSYCSNRYLLSAEPSVAASLDSASSVQRGVTVTPYGGMYNVCSSIKLLPLALLTLSSPTCSPKPPPAASRHPSPRCRHLSGRSTPSPFHSMIIQSTQASYLTPAKYNLMLTVVTNRGPRTLISHLVPSSTENLCKTLTLGWNTQSLISKAGASVTRLERSMSCCTPTILAVSQT
jgi:hypothetical protein